MLAHSNTNSNCNNNIILEYTSRKNTFFIVLPLFTLGNDSVSPFNIKPRVRPMQNLCQRFTSRAGTDAIYCSLHTNKQFLWKYFTDPESLVTELSLRLRSFKNMIYSMICKPSYTHSNNNFLYFVQKFCTVHELIECRICKFPTFSGTQLQ